MTILMAIMAIMVFWLICGILTYGIYKNTFKEYYAKHYYIGYVKENEFLSWVYAFCGPLGLIKVIVFLIDTGEAKIGFCFRMPSELTANYRSSKEYLTEGR